MAIGTGAALLGSAAIGGIGAILSGIIGSEAANSAATIQEKAALADVALQKQGLDYFKDTTERGRNDTLPWMEAGRSALDQYMIEMGLPPLTAQRAQAGPVAPAGTPAPGTPGTAPVSPGVSSTGLTTPGGGSGFNSDGTPKAGATGAPGSHSAPMVPSPEMQGTSVPPPGSPTPGTAGLGFQKTPGYEFQVSEGTKGVNNSLAAWGMKNSGSALKALTRFRTGLADSTYQTYLTRLSNLATGGQQQVNTTNALSMSGAGGVMGGLAGIGQTGQDAAAARASGYVGGANAWTNAIGNLSNTGGNTLGWLSHFGT